MKVILIKFAVLVVAGLFSHVLLAKDWLLTVPEDFDLKVVNGAKYSAPLFQSKHVQLLKLDKEREKQQIVMTYSQVFDDGDDMDVVKSKAFMVEFSSELQGEELAVEFDHPSDYSKARIFAKKPVVRITFNKGAVPVVLSYDVEQRSWVDSFVTSEPQGQVASAGASPVVSKPVAELKKTSAISQLFYWWDQASTSERETFIKHVSAP